MPNDVDELDDLSVAFFLLPIEVFNMLYEDLARLSDDAKASQLMYDKGFACGKLIINKIHNYDTKEEFLTNLNDVWIEVGLGIIGVVEENGNEYVFQCAESNEAKAWGLKGMKTCNFSCGYLAGMISAVTGTRHKCIEEACYSNRDGFCLYKVVPEH